jgi:protein-S-isoprenylcysteine O-methyltransferase Ste14
MKVGQWANVAVRELIWLGAFVFWAWYKKPAPASFLEVRPGVLGVIGLGLIVVGVVAHLWSAVALAMTIGNPAGLTSSLAKHGPYHYIRNPIYLAGVMVFVGIYLIYAELRVVDAAAAVVVGLLLHLYVVRVEEPATRKRLGATYDEYCRQVPRWLPRLPFLFKGKKGSEEAGRM